MIKHVIVSLTTSSRFNCLLVDWLCVAIYITKVDYGWWVLKTGGQLSKQSNSRDLPLASRDMIINFYTLVLLHVTR